ncbi:MAG: extracellular solute-binding protein [Bacillota bacterium]
MKKLNVLALMLVALFTLTACGGDDNDDLAEGEVALTFWNIFTGPDGEVMRQMVTDFNEEYEGEIRVSTQTIPETDFYEVFGTSVPQGEGPDIAIMHLRRIAKYAEMGLLNNFDNLIDEETMKENYIPAAWEGSNFEGSHYGIPLDVHPLGMYYNKDILDDAGVAVPTTHEELLAACDALEGYVDHCLPLSTMWPSQNVFISSLFQNDGEDLTDDHYPAFNTEEGYQALEVLNELIHTHNVSPTNVSVDEDLTYFRQGNAAFHINGIWMLNGIKESGVNFGTAPIATLFGDTPATWADSHNFVMPLQVNVSDEKYEAMMTFIEYITANSLRWAEAGQIPADISVLESDEFLALEDHQTFVDVDTIKFVTASPYVEDGFEPIFARVTTAMANENPDIQDLLDEAEEEATELVDIARGN